MLEPFDDDLALRMEHVGAGPIEVDLRPFRAAAEPAVVWASADGAVRVLAVAVHHEPVPDAVAYRVESPDGTVVISGDTRVCDEVERITAGADVLVHEACRTSAMAPLIEGSVFETIFSYHADTVALGSMAERAGVPHVLLTHLIPPPEDAAEEAGFTSDLRDGGYRGEITVGRDLATVVIGG
jgi:ribonuclease Z